MASTSALVRAWLGRLSDGESDGEAVADGPADPADPVGEGLAEGVSEESGDDVGAGLSSSPVSSPVAEGLGEGAGEGVAAATVSLVTPRASSSAGSTARTTPSPANSSREAIRVRRSARSASVGGSAPVVRSVRSLVEAVTGISVVTCDRPALAPVSHTRSVRSWSRPARPLDSVTSRPRGPHCSSSPRGRSPAGMVTEKVLISPGVMLSPRSPW